MSNVLEFLPGVTGFLPPPGVVDFCSFFLARKAANLGILLDGLLADSVRPGDHTKIQ